MPTRPCSASSRVREPHRSYDHPHSRQTAATPHPRDEVRPESVPSPVFFPSSPNRAATKRLELMQYDQLTCSHSFLRMPRSPLAAMTSRRLFHFPPLPPQLPLPWQPPLSLHIATNQPRLSQIVVLNATASPHLQRREMGGGMKSPASSPLMRRKNGLPAGRVCPRASSRLLSNRVSEPSSRRCGACKGRGRANSDMRCTWRVFCTWRAHTHTRLCTTFTANVLRYRCLNRGTTRLRTGPF